MCPADEVLPIVLSDRAIPYSSTPRLPDLFRRCCGNEEAACADLYRRIARMAAGIVRQSFPNLSRLGQEEAADRARFRIAEAFAVNVHSWTHRPGHFPRCARRRWAFANATAWSRFPIFPYGIVVISLHLRHCNWSPVSSKSAICRPHD